MAEDEIQLPLAVQEAGVAIDFTQTEANELAALRRTTQLSALEIGELKNNNHLLDEIAEGKIIPAGGVAELEREEIQEKKHTQQDADSFLKELTAEKIETINLDDPALDTSLRAALLHMRHQRHKEERAEYEKSAEITPEERAVAVEAVQPVEPPPQGKDAHAVAEVIDFSAIAALLAAASLGKEEPLHVEFEREVKSRELQETKPEPAQSADIISEKGIDFSALASLAASMRGMGIEERSMTPEEPITPASAPNVVNLGQHKVASFAL